MPASFRTITIDALDPYAQALWWSQALEHPLGEGDSPGDPECIVDMPVGPVLLFQVVPEEKAGKNRAHLDVEPGGRTRDEEVERLLGLGAVFSEDFRRPDGAGWVVLLDPEGNEFCVLRSSEERASAAG